MFTGTRGRRGGIVFVLVTVLQFWIYKKFLKNAILHLQSGNFRVVLPDILVFLKFYTNVPMETENSDAAIQFSIKNCIEKSGF